MLVPKKGCLEHLDISAKKRVFRTFRLNPSFVIRIKKRLITFACMYI